MIKNKVNPVAAEGASSYEGAGERRRGGEGGEKGENGYRRNHTRRTRRCLLISVVERNEELQTGWQAGRFLCSKLGLGWTERWVHYAPFMVYEQCSRVLVVLYVD